jgi:hypothetical protein
MTISLAFLAPDLVKAAIEGRLPSGLGVARLVDAPAEWSRQHQCRDFLLSRFTFEAAFGTHGLRPPGFLRPVTQLRIRAFEDAR